MKFTESLSQALVPEWRYQYVEYKKGKKLIKKVRAAVEDQANDRTPLLRPKDTHSYLNRDQPTIPQQPQTQQGSLQQSTQSTTKPALQFYQYLDEEYTKVESFYKEKEQEVYERFLILEDQLYQLKEHKGHTIKAHRTHKSMSPSSDTPVYHRVNQLAYHTKTIFGSLARYDLPSLPSSAFLRKFKRTKTGDISMTKSDVAQLDVNYFENRIRNGLGPGDSSDSDQTEEERQVTYNTYASTRQQPKKKVKTPASRQDYVTKKSFPVPFLFARKQLKEAMLEHYRSLILLRSYKELNKTAFRKITKKFEKLTHISLTSSYMERLHTESYFLTSTILDQLINQMEELYISFFDPESVDRKQSLEKLKSIAYALNNDSKDSFYPETFTSGLAIGFALPLFIIGLYSGLHKIYQDQFPEGIFLLQILGGFFLLNMMFLMFGLDLFIFEHFKINYKFIFEMNIGTALDSKQFILIPSLMFAGLSLLMWFSLNDYWPQQFAGRDWPWIYFGVGLGIFFWPFNNFYLGGRKYLQIALWRLIMSGFYPVEFRDFFLGDLLCSLTYTMGNISFYFCLYSHHWNGVVETLVGGTSEGSIGAGSCGSSKSRSMGFFAALPSIWRFLQCVRRYTDSGDWFPHLANMLKYGIGALYYCLLSVWRIHRTTKHKIVFVVIASINSIVTSIWDIVMDWSLLQVGSKNWLLRDTLFYHNPAYYYIAMISDVLFRFQWIFYVFFSSQIQQSAATSFFIAVAELIRRIIWVLFRMENEHVTNVILFRASKDSPLPYAVSLKVERAIKKLVTMKYSDDVITTMGSLSELEESADITSGASSGVRYPESIDSEAMERGTHASGTSMPFVTRRKSTLANFSEALNKAHIKDFQRKKTVAIEEDSDDESDKSEREVVDSEGEER